MIISLPLLESFPSTDTGSTTLVTTGGTTSTGNN